MKEYLNLAAKDIVNRLPDNHGFILLTFPFLSNGNNRLGYTSNCNREDAIKCIKEFLFQIGQSENWMKDIK
jgi:hypothetical protein